MRCDAPLRLASARARRTYLGGRLLDELHGIRPAADTHFPEDWICSTVRAVNAGRENLVEGLNVVAGTQMTLKEAIAAAPEAMLGAAHVAAWGLSPAVLVKLIDAAERLGVQVHPDKAKARELFGSPFGKTECWHIVGGRTVGGERPCVYMVFRPGVTRDAWRAVFDRQAGSWCRRASRRRRRASGGRRSSVRARRRALRWSAWTSRARCRSRLRRARSAASTCCRGAARSCPPPARRRWGRVTSSSCRRRRRRSGLWPRRRPRSSSSMPLGRRGRSGGRADCGTLIPDFLTGQWRTGSLSYFQTRNGKD